ncbi:MAG TPA: hypothetical protein VHO70_09665 [Chitinispirillaceae bacterium]|nr:hypothetical protein [Chitinispirillaceae bacterium]
MIQKNKTFLKMFILELEDLHQDIKLLIERYKDAREHESITNYVFMENIALMKNELFGIDSFHSEVKNLKPDNFSDIDELIAYCRQLLTKRCQEKGIAPSAIVLAERKMKKILTYIDRQQEESCSSTLDGMSALHSSL